MLKDITADLDADGGAWRNTFAPGALGVYCLPGQELRRAVGHGHGRLVVQQGSRSPRPASQAPPATWTEFLDDVKKLKAAGITPIALGRGRQVARHAHLVGISPRRIGGQAAFEAALNRKGAFADPPFVEAGEKLQELIAPQAVPDGFLGATYDEMQATALATARPPWS